MFPRDLKMLWMVQKWPRGNKYKVCEVINFASKAITPKLYIIPLKVCLRYCFLRKCPFNAIDICTFIEFFNKKIINKLIIEVFINKGNWIQLI